MYSDPSATVYSKLGMIRTLATASSGNRIVKAKMKTFWLFNNIK